MKIHHSGLLVDPLAGTIYGKKGLPLRKRHPSGYKIVRLPSGRDRMAHRVVWEAVHGEIPDGMEINHINGKKDDNRLCNLEVVTPSQNLRHAYATGLSKATGEKNGRALLTERDVRQIRASTSSIAALSRIYGVSKTAIRDARSGKRWSCVSMESAA